LKNQKVLDGFRKFISEIFINSEFPKILPSKNFPLYSMYVTLYAKIYTASKLRITELVILVPGLKLKYRFKHKQRQLWNVLTGIHGIHTLHGCKENKKEQFLHNQLLIKQTRLIKD